MDGEPLMFFHRNHAISDFPKLKKQRDDGPKGNNMRCKNML